MSSRPPAHSTGPGFTLIELLTVITIIAILMGLLFPAIIIVQNHVRKTEARTATTGIAAAVKQYYNDYGKYPVADYIGSGTPTDLKLGDQSRGGAQDSNADLFNILRGKNVGRNADNAYNPRRTVYFEHKSVKDPAAPRSGFLDQAGGSGIQGAFYDPWGKEYTIVIDANYNDVIGIASIYSDFAERSQDAVNTGTRTGVGVFSLGKDGEIGSPRDGVTGRYRDGNKISDDIITW